MYLSAQKLSTIGFKCRIKHTLLIFHVIFHMPTVTREDSDDDTVLFKATDRISPSETQNVAWPELPLLLTYHQNFSQYCQDSNFRKPTLGWSRKSTYIPLISTCLEICCSPHLLLLHTSYFDAKNFILLYTTYGIWLRLAITYIKYERGQKSTLAAKEKQFILPETFQGNQNLGVEVFNCRAKGSSDQ